MSTNKVVAINDTSTDTTQDTDTTTTLPDYVSVEEFEYMIWSVEGIRIIIRANKDTKIKRYRYSYAARRNWTLATWIKKRLKKHLDDGIEFVIVDGRGQPYPFGKTHLDTLRTSYNR